MYLTDTAAVPYAAASLAKWPKIKFSFGFWPKCTVQLIGNNQTKKGGAGAGYRGANRAYICMCMCSCVCVCTRRGELKAKCWPKMKRQSVAINTAKCKLTMRTQAKRARVARTREGDR